MSNPGQVRLTFHQHTFFELSTGSRTLFIDPVFSHERRGRRVADEVRTADYVLATSTTPWFEDALDVLEACEATFVSTPKLCRNVANELGLNKKRTLDLEPWERASEDPIRITAVPISCSLGMEGAIDEGTSILKDMTGIFPRGASKIPFLGQMMPMLNNGMSMGRSTLGNMSNLGQPKAVGKMGDLFGVDVGRITGGRPGLGFFIEIKDYPSILHLADGVHGMTSEEDLRDIADVCEPEVLIMQVDGMDVEPMVRASRIFRPKTVLLYRARDPYASGRRGQTLPVGSFIAAIEEGAPDSEPMHLRNGDSYVLERIGGQQPVTVSAPSYGAKAAPTASPSPRPINTPTGAVPAPGSAPKP